MSYIVNNVAMLDFLDKLRESDQSFTDWERGFLNNNFGPNYEFSDRQQNAITSMMNKYAHRIEWEPPSL